MERARFTKLVGLRIGTTRRRLSPADADPSQRCLSRYRSLGRCERAVRSEAGKWQAAILEAEQNRPNLRVV